MRSDRGSWAFGYCRVSSKVQAEEGMSLPAQREKITAYYEAMLRPKGIQWARFYEDPATSGRKSMDQRENGARLLAAAEKGDHIIMAKLDRGFRKAGDAAVTMERWGEMGVIFHMLDLQLDSSTPMGRMILGIMSYFAAFERDRISERTRDVMAYRKRAGLPTGKPPYGFKCVGPKGHRTLVPDPEQREIGRHIVKWKMSGFSWEEIYWHLHKLNVKSRRGLTATKEWSLGAIRRAFEGECRLMADEEAVKLGKKSSQR